MDEKWKPIPGYEGFYEVSDQGRVYSNWSGSILKGTADKQGYLTVTLCDGSTRRALKIHRLVMSAFVGPSDLLVLHDDDDPSNNVLSNLRYGTYEDNKADSIRRGRILKGDRHPNSKVSEAKQREITNRVLNLGETRASLAPEYGVSEATISRIVKRTREN